MKNRDFIPKSIESRHFLKGIASKLIFAVLGAVIIPFLGLIYFIDTQIDTRLKENIVKQSLLSLASDLANEVNVMMKKRNADLLLMSSGILVRNAINESYLRPDLKNSILPGKMIKFGTKKSSREFLLIPESNITKSSGIFWRTAQNEVFNRIVFLRKVYDLILLVDEKGILVNCSTKDSNGTSLDPNIISQLFTRNFKNETWFRNVFKGGIERVDHHVTNLLPRDFLKSNDPSSFYHIGFAAPVYDYIEKDKVIGVIYTLVNWKHIQELMDVPRIKAYFSGLVKDKEPSPYAWIWGADADTILAHKDRGLYNKKVSGPEVQLPQMVKDARSSKFGLYQEYIFKNKKKNAAFYHCNGPKQGLLHGGFGWVVGVGIDNDDIYAMAEKLRRLLYYSTSIVVIVVVIWILVIARRTTKPILALQKHMKKVSRGDLDTQIKINTGDEISDLADDFNQMIIELKEKRAQIIKAEKSAAWREMAQQISHDIKNNLTPLKLSVGLLKEAVKNDSPAYKQILQKTLRLIDTQTKNLGEIALNFYEFTGGRKSVLKKCNFGILISEALELNRLWAQELNIRIQGVENLKDQKVIILTDEMKLYRVLTNIISNAFEAMPDGGTLTVSLQSKDGWAILDIRDTGIGISEEVRAHLFEPYFTTRSKGTGLGLAIAKQVIEESGGTIFIKSNTGVNEKGTCVHIRLPLAKSVNEEKQ